MHEACECTCGLTPPQSWLSSCSAEVSARWIPVTLCICTSKWHTQVSICNVNEDSLPGIAAAACLCGTHGCRRNTADLYGGMKMYAYIFSYQQCLLQWMVSRHMLQQGSKCTSLWRCPCITCFCPPIMQAGHACHFKHRNRPDVMYLL